MHGGWISYSWELMTAASVVEWLAAGYWGFATKATPQPKDEPAKQASPMSDVMTDRIVSGDASDAASPTSPSNRNSESSSYRPPSTHASPPPPPAKNEHSYAQAYVPPSAGAIPYSHYGEDRRASQSQQQGDSTYSSYKPPNPFV
jgi:hypothetical protein